MLFWLVACGARWTEPAVVAPTLAHMDADGSGRVEKAEYDAVLYNGEPFEEVDTDGDGALSAAELLATIAATDPTQAIAPPGAKAARVVRDAAAQKPPDAAPPTGKHEDALVDDAALRSEAQLVVKMILESLREEVRAVAPNHAAPTDDEIKFAAGTADIRTAESRALLLRLEASSDEVGVDFPASLRAAALRDRPVVASYVPDPDAALPGQGGPDRLGAGGPPGGPPPRPRAQRSP